MAVAKCTSALHWYLHCMSTVPQKQFQLSSSPGSLGSARNQVVPRAYIYKLPGLFWSFPFVFVCFVIDKGLSIASFIGKNRNAHVVHAGKTFYVKPFTQILGNLRFPKFSLSRDTLQGSLVKTAAVFPCSALNEKVYDWYDSRSLPVDLFCPHIKSQSLRALNLCWVLYTLLCGTWSSLSRT